MSKELIKQRILKGKPELKKEFELPSRRTDVEDDEHDAEVVDNFLQEDANIFLLNNILLTIQFFKNYERDVETLRERWFKETRLESHHKKCFYADSLFRESGAKVKFSTLHGVNKNVAKDFLHPVRTYISSDNVEAAFDPALLGRVEKNFWPQYQFVVKMDENDERSGRVSLILFKALESPKKRFDSMTVINDDFNAGKAQGKSDNDAKGKKLTRTDKFFTSHNRELYFKMQGKISLKCSDEISEGTMPPNCFYCFPAPEDSLSPISITKYRMNATPGSDLEIPSLCFQRELIETNLAPRRRTAAGKLPRARRVLNSAAFKGYFCDLLIEKLAEPLGFDVNDVEAGVVHEEFAIFGQTMKSHVTPAIEISDWNSYISLTEHRFNGKVARQEMPWPTDPMWQIMNILPCYAVPHGLSDLSRKNLDHEKKWKIIFPKTEQFLLLHMMHSQIRCYFFILSIYKTFIEPKINSASLGPRHLLHLLFWQVHKNFLAWPDERPAETLLNYLKILYRKLQNKHLRDFFINSHNLFASSFAKDIHKAQALIKIILQNPVPYVLRAIKNLEFDSDFYPAFEVVKVNAILSPISIAKNQPGRLKRKKKVCFEDAQELLRRKSIRQMQSVLKCAEREIVKESISVTDAEDVVNFDFRDAQKLSQILEILILHYIEMGSVSIEFKFLTQALMYLFQIQSLFKLVYKNLGKEDLEALRQKISKLKEKCDTSEREKKLNRTMPSDEKNITADPRTKSKVQQTKRQKIYDKSHAKIKPLPKPNFSDQVLDKSEECETKL